VVEVEVGGLWSRRYIRRPFKTAAGRSSPRRPSTIPPRMVSIISRESKRSLFGFTDPDQQLDGFLDPDPRLLIMDPNHLILNLNNKKKSKSINLKESNI